MGRVLMKLMKWQKIVSEMLQGKRKKYLLFALILVVLLIGIYLLNHPQKASKTTANFTAVVQSYQVTRQDMVKRVTLSGATVPDAQVDLAPKYAGRITAINVNLGDHVQAGDVLLVQDQGDLDISINENSAAARQAEADVRTEETSYRSDYVKAQVDFDQANTNYNRYVVLFNQGAVSQQALEDMYQLMMSAKATLENLQNQGMDGTPAVIESKRAAYAKAGYTVDGLQKQRTDMEILAPRDGVIGYRNAEVGAIATAGQKVLSLVDNRIMYVDCQVSEGDIGAIPVGLAVTVAIDSLGKNYDGHVTYISPAMDSSSSSYIVRLALDATGGQLLGGMFARTEISVVQRKNTLFVPKDSVVTLNGKSNVFVINADGTVESRNVKAGLRNDQFVEIVEGLAVGDTVAVSNIARLKSGMAVEIAKDNG